MERGSAGVVFFQNVISKKNGRKFWGCRWKETSFSREAPARTGFFATPTRLSNSGLTPPAKGEACALAGPRRPPVVCPRRVCRLG